MFTRFPPPNEENPAAISTDATGYYAIGFSWFHRERVGALAALETGSRHSFRCGAEHVRVLICLRMAEGVRKIYLCGPIMDADPKAAKDWRTRAKERLAGRFILLDPLRRNFRDNEIDSSNEIVEFDLQDVRAADLLLVNYCKPSLGTAMEVFYASHDLGKFVIAFSPFSYADCSPWMIRYCTKILPDLDSALIYIERHFP